MLAGGFGPPKAQGAGDLQSPGIDHYPKLAYQKLSLVCESSNFSVGYHLCVAGLPAIAFKMRAPSHIIIDTKRRSVHASALFYSLHDSNIRIKPVELAEYYPRFRFCLSSSI